MNMYEVESTFDNFLEMADTLDYQEGAGIRLLSNGSSTTRQAVKNEVGLFMLSLVDGLNYVTYEQKHLLDLALEKGFEDADSDRVLQMADSIDSPYGRDNVSINAFVLHDLMSTKTTHEYTTSASDAMVGMFRMMGQAIMAAGLDTTSLSQMRFDNYMSGLETKALLAQHDLEDTANKLVKAQEPEKPAQASKKTSSAAAKTYSSGNGVDVDKYIPAGVTLTDNQKEYLATIADLIEKNGSTDSSIVAMWMHRTQSQVSSAVKTLTKKGILEINDDAKIVFADHIGEEEEEEEPKPAKAKPKSSAAKQSNKISVGYFNEKQYKGIHQVKRQEETISPNGIWSIPVQSGWSYSMDPDCTKMSMMGKYPLQIQSTADCNFEDPYDSRFNFVLFAFGPSINAFSAITDLSSNEAGKEMTTLAWGADADYKFFKQTDRIAIMTKDVNANQSEYSVLFLIFVSGTQFVSHGQVSRFSCM